MPINFNINPYYDDFDADKGFLRILFRPGYAVQARELTQMQSILQEQMGSFGAGIYKNGSIVYGANSTVDENAQYIVLESQYDNADVTDTLAGLVGKTIVTKNNPVVPLTGFQESRYYVLGYQAATDTTPPLIYVNLIGGEGVVGTEDFADDSDDTRTSVLRVVDAVGTSLKGKATFISLNEGVFYINNFFVHSPAQSIAVADEYNGNYPAECRVGLQISNVIVDEDDDVTLLDPAEGSYNYTAPGGHRYTIQLDLERRDTFGLDETDDTAIIDGSADIDYIELFRFIGGVLSRAVKYPIYSAIGDEMARRTYDINGNFVTDDFMLQIDEHIGGEEDKLTMSIEEGRAFVHGYQFDTTGVTRETLNKSRDYDVSESTNIGVGYGNYIVTNRHDGVFNIEAQPSVDLVRVRKEPFSAFLTIDHDTAGTPWTVNNPEEVTEVAKDMKVKISFAGATKWGTIDAWADLTGNERTYFIKRTTDGQASYGNTSLQQWSGVEEGDNNNTVEIYDSTGQDLLFTYTGTSNNVDVTAIPAKAYEESFKIGTARVRQIRFSEEDQTNFFGLGTELDIKNRTYLFDIKVERNSFQNLETIAIAGTNGDGNYEYSVKADVADDGKTGAEDNGTTILFDAAFNDLIFELPQPNIRSIKSGGLTAAEGGANDIDYSYQKLYTNITIPNAGSGGVDSAPIVSPDSINLFYPSAGTIPGSTAQLYYSMIIRSGGFTDANGNTYTAGDYVDLGPTSGITLSIDLGRPDDSTDTLRIAFPSTSGNAIAPSVGTTFDLLATLNVNNGAEKSKSLSNKTITFEAPNGVGGEADNLYTSDVYDIVGIWDSGDPDTAIVVTDYTIDDDGNLLDGDGEIAFTNQASKYVLSTGQKDNYYDYGSIQLSVGEEGPSGQLSVRFRYFQHLTAGNTGVFTVNSYNDVAYKDIPQFVSPTTGATYELRDVLDFRPRRRDASITNDTVTPTADSVTTFDELEGAVLPLPTSTVDVDFSYYLSRKDRLVITSALKLEVIEGVSDLDPLEPKMPDDALLLYDIEVPAYTFNPEDVLFLYRPVSNYTMEEIAGLEQRISDLEYITNINALEKEAEDLVLEGPDGSLSLKTGLLVDGFVGHQIGDVSNADYDIAIDPEEGAMRPPFVEVQAEMELDEEASNNIRLTGELITLPYTNEILVSQPLTSKAINVNPYNVTNFLGTMELSPQRDDWVEIEQRPTLKINLAGEFDNWRADVPLLNSAIRRWRNRNSRRLIGVGTQWNSWETTWSGRSTSTSSRIETNTSTRRSGRRRDITTTRTRVTRRTTTLTRRQVRTGVRTRVGLTTVQRSLGNRVVNLSIVPWMRSKDVLFVAKGMRPNTEVFAFFDDVNVDAHVRPANGLNLVGAGLTYGAGARDDEKVFLPKERVNVYDTSDPSTILGHGFVVSGNDGSSGQILLADLTSETSFNTRIVKKTLRTTQTVTGKWSELVGRRHNKRIIHRFNVSDILGNDVNGRQIVAKTLKITGIRVRGDLNASSEYIVIRFPVNPRVWRGRLWRWRQWWRWSTTRFLAGRFSGVRADGTLRDDTNFTERNVTTGIYTNDGSQFVNIWFDPTDAVNYSPGTMKRNGDRNWWQAQLEFEATYEVERTVDDIITETNPGTQAAIDQIINDNSRILEIAGTETTYTDPETGVVLTRTPPTARISGRTETNFGDQLKTNGAGVVTGLFRIPNEGENGLRFRTGERKFLLHDNPNTSDVANSTTSADASYFASGQKKVMQNTTVSTRAIGLIRETVTETRTVRNVVNRSTSRQTLSQSTRVRWVDPVAQTFLVDGTVYPNGMFITALDLFFRSKDAELPVQVQIRPTQNGYPDSAAIIPFADVEIQPSQVNIPSNRFDNETVLATPTRVTFESPVYLVPGEYALVVLTNSANYEVYVSEMGQQILGSSKRISEQPYAGSLFKSQNASTWTAEQLEDLMFKLYRAKFDISQVGEAVLGQYELEEQEPYQAFQSKINVIDDIDAVSISASYLPTTQAAADLDDDADNALSTAYIPFEPGETVYTKTENIVGPEAGTFYLRYELRSNDETVSPVLDVDPCSTLFIDQQINNGDIEGDDIIVQTKGTGYDPLDPPSTDNNRIIVTGTGSGVNIEALVADGTVEGYDSGDLYGFNVINGGQGFVETPTITVTEEGPGETAPVLLISGETNRAGGNSIARYITRRVTLPDERLYSDNMLVTLTAIKPRGSRVEVYYKVLSQTDPTEFDELEYTRMELQGEVEEFSDNADDEVILNFRPLNKETVKYTNPEGVEYDNFITFAIKIALYADNKVDVPIVRDMKTVAGKI